MDAPLGRAVGNALETAEAFAVLRDEGPDDVRELTLVLGAEMLGLAGIARGAAARRTLEQALADGSALRVMERVVKAQGGDPRAVSEPDRLPRAPFVRRVRAERSGFVRAIDALEVGLAAVELGAGRARADDAVDPRVGFVFRARVGERVEAGQILFEVHGASRGGATRVAAERVSAAMTVGTRRAAAPAPPVIGVMRR